MRLPCDRPVNLSFAPCPMCRYEETAERIGSQCIAPVEQRKTVMLGLAFVFAAVGLTILAGMAVLIGRGI